MQKNVIADGEMIQNKFTITSRIGIKVVPSGINIKEATKTAHIKCNQDMSQAKNREP